MSSYRSRRRPFLLGALSTAAALAPQLSHGQDKYPSRPVKLIVPFPPGGNADATGRIVAEALTAQLGQNVVVFNQGGAGGMIGAAAAAQAAPDGYTLLCATTGPILVAWQLAGQAATYRLSELQPLAMLTMVPYVLVVNETSPVRSWQDFLDLAKRRPKDIKCGHPGNGTTGHVDLLQLQDALKTEFIIAAYRGAGPAVQDLLGGQLDLVATDLPSALQLIKTGKLRAIAAVANGRVSSLPDVPTMAELNLSQVDAITFTALLGPRNLPADVAARLSEAAGRLLDTDAVRQRLDDIGTTPWKMSPAELGKFLDQQAAIYTGLIKSGLLQSQ